MPSLNSPEDGCPATPPEERKAALAISLFDCVEAISEWQRPHASPPTYPLVDARDLVGHHPGPLMRSAVVSGNSFEGDCCWAAVTNKAAQHNTNADTRKPESLVSLTVFNSMSQFTSEWFDYRAKCAREKRLKLHLPAFESLSAAAGRPRSCAAFKSLKIDSCCFW